MTPSRSLVFPDRVRIYSVDKRDFDGRYQSCGAYRIIGVDLPPDAMVVMMRYDDWGRAIEVLVHSNEYPAVSPGGEYPDLGRVDVEPIPGRETESFTIEAREGDKSGATSYPGSRVFPRPSPPWCAYPCGHCCQPPMLYQRDDESHGVAVYELCRYYWMSPGDARQLDYGLDDRSGWLKRLAPFADQLPNDAKLISVSIPCDGSDRTMFLVHSETFDWDESPERDKEKDAVELLMPDTT